MKTITAFEVVDHGIDGSQYFPGCGVAFTKFEHVATGCGDDFAEAIDDALESIAQDVSGKVDFVSFEQAIKDNLDCKTVSWPKSDSASELYPAEDSEMYYYVSIRYTVEDSPAVATA